MRQLPAPVPDAEEDTELLAACGRLKHMCSLQQLGLQEGAQTMAITPTLKFHRGKVCVCVWM